MLRLSLSEALSQLKNNRLKFIERLRISSLCKEFGLKGRKRLLTPEITIELFFLQILDGNTAINGIIRFSKKVFTASAYCQARSKLPVELFKTLLAQMTKNQSAMKTWLGRRLLLVDGSTFSMSDTAELMEHFGQPSGQKEGCGFPMAHFLAIMHAGSGLIQELLPGKLFTSDLTSFVKLHSSLKKADVVVGDRGFCSYVNFWLLIAREVDAVFRMHQRRKFSLDNSGSKKSSIIRKKLGVDDQLVTWFKPEKPPLWMSQEQYKEIPEQVILRELRYVVKQKGFRVEEIVIVTTLLNAESFSKEAIEEVYQQRWQIETNFGHLKTTMKMDVVRCKSVDGVLRELYGFAIIYNVLCSIMIQAADQIGCCIRRISFIDTIRWLLAACRDKIELSILTNPLRPGRVEPRAIKRRPKPYDLLTKPRQTLIKQALNA